jgi:hypothetical protein
MTDTRNANLNFAASDFLAFCAPLGTTLPSDFSDLASPWLCLGWMTQDGPTVKSNRQTKDLYAAGSLTPIRTLTTSQTRTVDCTAEEALNPMVRALVDDVALASLQPTGGIVSYDLPDIDPDHRYAFVFDSMDGSKRIRVCAPNGKVTARGDEKRSTVDSDDLQMTITLYKATDGSASMTQLVNWDTIDVSLFFA